MLIVALGYIFLNVLLQTSTPTPPGNLSPVPKPIMKHLLIYYEKRISETQRDRTGIGSTVYLSNTKWPPIYIVQCKPYERGFGS